jgi:peptidoglycan hydrolase-like protein with peptidoglycan-binding domain
MIDGTFQKGKKTEAAVREFQKDNDLKPDGIPGKETIRVLLEKLNEQEDKEGEKKNKNKNKKENKEEKKDPLEGVKVKESIQITDEEVKAEDLVD